MAEYSQKWWFANGQLATSQRAAVFFEDQNTYVPIFADPGMTIPLANPNTTNGSGVFTFYAAEAYYWVFVGDVDKGGAVLSRVGPTPSGPVLSVNSIGPDGAGNVELDAADVGAIPLDDVVQKGDLLVGTAPGMVARLPVGAPDQALFADPSFPTGLQWASILELVDSVNGKQGVVVLDSEDVGSQPLATIQAKGDLYVGTANDATSRLPVGADGQFLAANSATATGLSWIAPPSSPVLSVNTHTGIVVLNSADVGAQPLATIDAKGDLYAGTGDNSTTRQPVGVDGQILSSSSASSTGLAWITAPSAPVTSVNGHVGAVVLTTGDIGAVPTTRQVSAGTALTGGGDLSADRTFNVNIGTTSGSVAAGDDARITGAQQRSALTTKGDLLATVASASTTRLPVGVDGQVLTADSSQSTGLAWGTPVGTGDVIGPGSSTNTGIARYNGTTGKIIQDSGVTVTDTGGLVLPGQGFPPPYVDGEVYYDTNFHSLAFTNDNSSVVLKVGQQEYVRVLNNAGITISTGLAVYVTGSDVTFPYAPTIDRTSWTGEPQSHAIGLAAETIPSGNYGYVLIQGLLYGVPTSSFNYGDYLYVGPGNGALTNAKPVAPNFACCVGMVTVSDISHGTISVFRTQAALGLGSANQVRGVNTAGTAEENKTLQGTSGRLTVTQGIGSVTFDVDNTVLNTKVDKSTLGAKGSLIGATAAATPTDVPVGTNGQVLTADSAQTSGLSWTTPTAGVPPTRLINTTNGLTGGGDLSADRTLQPTYGTVANTVAQGSDTRIVNAVQNTRAVNTTNGLTGGGDLSADRTIQPVYGTTAGSVTEGNDARVTGAQQRSDLTTKGDIYVATASATTTRLPSGGNNQFLRSQSSTGTGLRWDTITATDVSAVPTTRNVTTINGIQGGGALSADLTLLPTYGTIANTVAQGNDTRIVNAVQGPASSTDTAVALYNGTTGKLVRNSTVLVDATGTITLPAQGSPPSTPGQFNSSGSNLFFTFNDPTQTQVSLGQQVFMLVNNNSGVNIASGSAAYITGVSGSKSFVSAARANALATSKVAGVAAGHINAGDDGYLLCQGVGTIDTTGMAINDTLYLSTAVGGALTNVAPTAPDFLVKVGTVASVAVAGKVNIYIDLPKNGIGTNGQVELANSAAGLGTQWLNSLSCGISPQGAIAMPAGGIEVARSNGTATLNLMYLLPVSLLRAASLSGVLVEVTGNTVGSVMRAGIYGSSSSNQPTGSPLADFGTIPTATAGVKLWSPPTFAMSPGVLYYIALVAQTAAPNVRLFTGFNPYVPAATFPAGATVGWSVAWTQSGVSGVLPPIGTLSSSNAPVTGLLF